MEQREYLFETFSVPEAYHRALQMDSEVWDQAGYKTEHSVQVNHQDGSVYIIRHVHIRYARYRNGDLLVIYPEHNMPSVFSLGDINSVVTFDGEEEHVIYGELKETDYLDEEDEDEGLVLEKGMPEELREEAAKEVEQQRDRVLSIIQQHAIFDIEAGGPVLVRSLFEKVANEITGYKG